MCVHRWSKPYYPLLPMSEYLWQRCARCGRERIAQAPDPVFEAIGDVLTVLTAFGLLLLVAINAWRIVAHH